MCQGLNSHYFHTIGDKLINSIVGVYIPIIRIPIKGWMIIPNTRSLDPGSHVRQTVFVLPTRHIFLWKIVFSPRFYHSNWKLAGTMFHKENHDFLESPCFFSPTKNTNHTCYSLPLRICGAEKLFPFQAAQVADKTILLETWWKPETLEQPVERLVNQQTSRRSPMAEVRRERHRMSWNLWGENWSPTTKKKGTMKKGPLVV